MATASLAETEGARNFLVASFYGFTSVAMTFLNKAVLGTYHFDYANFVMFVQAIGTVVLIYGLDKSQVVPLRLWDVERLKQFTVVGCLYSLNVIAGLSALARLSVPMYGVLKRFTIVVVLVSEILVYGKKTSKEVVVACAVMTLGALFAGMNDVYFDGFGYLLGGISVALQAAYLVIVGKKGLESGLNTFEISWYNSIVSFPIMFLMLLYSGEHVAALNEAELWNDSRFVLLFGLTIVFGFVLNYSIFLCATVNSALTVTVVGQAKNAITTVLGFLVFRLHLDARNIMGITLNAVGGVMYSKAKWDESQARKLRTKMEESSKV